MSTPRSFGRTDFWIFGAPVILLVLLPLLSWLVVYITQDRDGISSDAMWYLFCMVVCWVAIPGALFRGPLFEATDIAYSPRGILGWILVFGFYIVLSLIISLTLRAIIHARRRRRHI